jgi:O-antigen/teichoic acid export membrane protein
LICSLGISIYLLRGNSQDLTAPFKGIAYAQLAVAIVFVLVYGKGAFARSINKNEISILLKFGVPTVITSIAAMTIDWADRIFIGRMLSVEDVGIYSAGFRLGSIVNALVIVPFTQIWNPMMIEYRSHANIAEFFSRIVSYYFLVSSMILIVACFFVREALPIVARSSAYAGASPVILLVMAGYLLYGSSNILGAGVIYERRIFRFALVYYVIAIVKMGLNLYFIPHFGIIGAAATTLLIYALIPALVYWQASRYFAIQFEAGRLLRIFLIVALALFFGLYLDVRFAFHLPVKMSLFLLLIVVLALFGTDETEKRHIGRLIFNRA